MKYCEKCGTELVDGKCPNCKHVNETRKEKVVEKEEVKTEPVVNPIPKKKSKKGLIIFLIILFVVLAAGIGILLFFLLGDKGDPITRDTWEVTYQYKNKTKSTAKLKFNKDNTFEYTQTNGNNSKKQTITGTWKKDGNKYVVTIKDGDEDSDTDFYIKDDDTLCYGEKNCSKNYQYYRSSSNVNKVIKEEDIYPDDDDDDDYDDDDYDYDDDDDDDYDYDNDDEGNYLKAKPDTKGKYSFQMTYDKKKDSKKVVINVFYGDGCPHCEELFEYLDGLDKDTKSKFVVQKYETWYNNDNAALMQEVSDDRSDDAAGVPYILIGNKSWNGFADSYKDEILGAINAGTGGSYKNYVEWILE